MVWWPNTRSVRLWFDFNGCHMSCQVKLCHVMSCHVMSTTVHTSKMDIRFPHSLFQKEYELSTALVVRIIITITIIEERKDGRSNHYHHHQYHYHRRKVSWWKEGDNRGGSRSIVIPYYHYHCHCYCHCHRWKLPPSLPRHKQRRCCCYERESIVQSSTKKQGSKSRSGRMVS